MWMCNLYAVHVFPKAFFSCSNSTLKRFSGRGRDIEIGMRNTSSKTSSQKALLEESDEE